MASMVTTAPCKERVKGAILIQNDRSARDHEKEDPALLNSISRHIALAIERKESEEQLAKHRRMLYSNDEDFENVGQNIYQSVITGGTADYPGNTKIIDIWGVGKDMEH
jgi:hypothetical protein